MTQNLEERFQSQLINIYERAKVECDYNAIRFLQMIHEQGAIETARKLIMSPDLSQGITALWECGRLDITVEALVLREPWSQLFPEEVLTTAREKLNQLGYQA